MEGKTVTRKTTENKKIKISKTKAKQNMKHTHTLKTESVLMLVSYPGHGTYPSVVDILSDSVEENWFSLPQQVAITKSFLLGVRLCWLSFSVLGVLSVLSLCRSRQSLWVHICICCVVPGDAHYIWCSLACFTELLFHMHQWVIFVSFLQCLLDRLIKH